MANKQRSIRLDDEVFDSFKKLSDDEGRNYNKVLAILLATYFKSKK